jgi:polyisoprenoid-binding protein YceI
MKTHLLRLCALLAGITLATAASAAPQEFSIDPAHTHATFEVNHLGISTQRGRFSGAVGKVLLDAEAGSGSLEIALDARSISTGSEFMESLLRGNSFFNVEQHPRITLQSQSIQFEGGKPVRIDGQLTLLGTTRPVSLAVVGYDCTRKPFLIRVTCGMDAQTVIKRSEFGMTSVLGFVGDEVRLLIQAEAVRQDVPAAPP